MNDMSVDPTAQPLFFCGIGGSGMLPLAMIARGLGAEVAGSDRSRDQGRTPEKFAWLESKGITLFPQDGSGIVSAEQVLVASAAIEDTVPEVAKANALGCRRMTRAELLSDLFNAAPCGIAIGGTSGKSTVTGMLGWVMYEAEKNPTIMNGAVMKNFASEAEPFASAVVGEGETFVSEVDESDGSIALYKPAVSVLLNVSLDHKSVEELRVLFRNFLCAGAKRAVNFDNEEAYDLADGLQDVVSFAIDHPEARIAVLEDTIDEKPNGISALLIDRQADNTVHPLRLGMPGRHNLSNALAAIAGAVAAGVPMHDACVALSGFRGIARRFDVIGTSPGGVTVIDDFGHNPEKCRATLRTLKRQPGRVIAFFQPHGYGPLRQMGQDLARTFAKELGPDDVTLLCDPVYYGGTVDRSDGSERIISLIAKAGGNAEYIAERSAVADRIVEIARPGDRVVVMGARDDTLTIFAKGLLSRLP